MEEWNRDAFQPSQQDCPEYNVINPDFMQSPPSSWDPGRFLKTLAYFDAIPFFSCIRRLLGQSQAPAAVLLEGDRPQETTVFDFTTLSPTALQTTWGALDDVVMGGVSESTLQSTPEGAVFTGNVSTANSGGFASVRTRNFEQPLNLSGYTGIQLRVKGDGKRYKFLLRSESGWDSTAYAHSFDTVADQWITIQIPFTTLIPVFRARTVPIAAPLDQSRVSSLQLMLSKFEYDGTLNPHFSAGSFTLSVASITAY